LTKFNTIREKCVESGVQSVTRLLARGPTVALLVLNDQAAAARAREVKHKCHTHATSRHTHVTPVLCNTCVT
jgi:hypothetical protein